MDTRVRYPDDGIERKPQLPLPTPQQTHRLRRASGGPGLGDPAETASRRQASPFHAPQQRRGGGRSFSGSLTAPGPSRGWSRKERPPSPSRTRPATQRRTLPEPHRVS